MSLVTTLLVADGADFVTRSVPNVELTFSGLAADLHAGATRGADSRTPWHPRGTPIANTRQVSLVSVEDCAAIAQALGLTFVDPALLGTNLVLAGIEDFSLLLPSSRLQFPSGATIFLTEPNAPCRQPGRKLAQAHGDPGLEFAFPKRAMGLRGMVGLVEREGTVRVGDAVKLLRPAYRPEKVRLATAGIPAPS